MCVGFLRWSFKRKGGVLAIIELFSAILKIEKKAKNSKKQPFFAQNRLFLTKKRDILDRGRRPRSGAFECHFDGLVD